jgi:signal transduction histidine kinase
MVLLGLLRSGFSEGHGWTEAVFAVALLGWYAVGASGGATRVGSANLLWVAGLSLLCLMALWVSPDFAWVSFAVFVTYANVLPPAAAIWAIAAVAVGTGGMLVARWPDDGHWTGQIVGPVVGAAVAGALVGVSRLSAAETAERQRLLDELLAARDDLARAHLDAGARGERERLTREIHDTLAQGFTSVVLAARRARQAVQKGDATATCDELDHLEDIGRAGVEGARRLVGRLPPAELDDRPLPAALGLLARPGPDEDPPTIEVRIDGDARPLPSAVDVALLRVAQEAVTNARRHAGAHRVVVTLTYQPGAVRLDVVDDGVGFHHARRSGRGFGLASMRSRVEQLGGTFIVESAAGQGVAVNATIPIGATDLVVPA